MSTKLALYFISQGDTSRVLDVEHGPPEKHEWRVGRTSDNQITFRNGLVSKRHAIIRATLDKEASIESEEPCYRWEVIDLLSTNGTFLESGSLPYRCAPNVPYQLEDRAVLQFGTVQARVRVSFDIDDTKSDLLDDTDPSTEQVEERCDRKASAPWWADTVIEPFWAWFLKQNPFAQLVILSIGTAAAVVVIVEVWGK